MIVWWCLVVAFVVFVATIVVRALLFKPAKQQAVEVVPFPVRKETAIDHLQQMIRLRTVSNSDESKVDQEPFDQFRKLLPTLYPTVYAACEHQTVGKHGILIRWKGRSDKAPAVLMAHYDVVPVNEAEWDEPPFDAVIRDGEMWGRGTLDTKCTLLGVMEAAEALIKEGFVPQNDVYLAFGGDEECMGSDAVAIVDELQRRGVRPALVLDEGGAIVENVFPGVKQPAALIGIAEKGSAFVDVTAAGKGGHASAPPSVQSVGVLSRAVGKLHQKAMPFKLTAPAAQLFDLMGRNSTFAFRLIFANLWCFRPLLDMICKMSGGEMNALVRTTCALTRLSAAPAYNVLPTQSCAGLNLRIICGESVDEVKARLEKTINDKRVCVEVKQGSDPSPISPAQGEPWDRVAQAIRETYPGVLVSPYLMLAASDSRHYCRICDNVYRFSGMPLSKAQRGMIHNNNERIPLDLIPDAVAFFGRVLRRC